MTVGVLAIHGYTGGPYEVEPLGTYIEARFDVHVHYVTLQGHGEQLALRGCRYRQWLLDVELAYRTLQRQVDEVIVIGFSMGGLLALYLASRYPVKRLVLLSAAVHYLNPLQLSKDIVALVKEPTSNQRTFQSYKRKFGKVPVRSAIEFMSCARYVMPLIHRVTAPTFIVQGQQDEMVRPSSAQYLYNNISAKEKFLYYSKTGKHHICFSDDREKWFQKIIEFIFFNNIEVVNE